MKKDIHPKYYKARVKCICGAEYEFGSTLPEINVEICSACHPFFSGGEKIVDTTGRVERFQRLKKVSEAKKQKRNSPKK